jgi:hypothetical protein
VIESFILKSGFDLETVNLLLLLSINVLLKLGRAVPSFR